MASFVLVHGAWHGAWCWYRIVPRLERLGHRVLAIDLPGHGRRQLGRSPTLAEYFDATVAALESLPEPAVLVGHSMGGVVIAGTCERAPQRVREAVYLTAYLVPAGAAMSAESGEDPDSLLGPQVRASADGAHLEIAPEALRPGLYGDCSDEDVALARACLTPQPIAVLGTPVPLTAERFGRVPRSYIECTRDRAIGLAQQRRYQSYHPPRRVLSLACDHSPFFSRPDELAALLDRIATTTA